MKSQSKYLLALMAAVLLAGCRQDMHDTPRYEASESSRTFADNRASRNPPAGTIAWKPGSAGGTASGVPAPSWGMRASVTVTNGRAIAAGAAPVAGRLVPSPDADHPRPRTPIRHDPLT